MRSLSLPLVLWAVSGAAGAAAEIAAPAPLIIGNLGRYPLGHQSAIEGGAMVARAAGAEAAWVNPAGVADKSGAPGSASASLYAFDVITVSNASEMYRNWEAYIIPSAVGGAFPVPGTAERVQMAVYLTQPALWSSEVSFSRLDPLDASGGSSQAVSESIGRYEVISPGAAFATMLSTRIAIGVALNVSYISYRLSTNETRRSRAADGSVSELSAANLTRIGSYVLQPKISTRFDLGGGWNGGVVLEFQSTEVYHFGRVDSTGIVNRAGTSTSVLHYDDSPSVNWDLPATVTVGCGHFADTWALELDLRWRASLGSRDVVSSDTLAYGTVTNHATGAVTTSSAPVAPLQTAGPSALGGSFGGHVECSAKFSLHSGIWYDPSPVANAEDDLFTPMDIWGVSLGATYRSDEKTTFSLGLLGTYGKAENVQVFPDPVDPTGGTATIYGLQAALTTSFTL